MAKLDGKVAIVTGGAASIGAAITLTLHAERARVVIAARSADKGAALAAELGDRARFVASDITNDDALRALREPHADRIVARLCTLVPDLADTILARHVVSPADLERLNVNFVGGNPYSGACSIDQFMLRRPLATPGTHATPLGRLHHIGASTHPGPGLGDMSGYMAAGRIG